MLEKDTFAELRHSREEEFFLRKEKELIEKLKQRAALEDELRRLHASKDIANEAILGDLEHLGFNRDTLSLMYLVPLLYVAWSEGFVTAPERAQIIEAARSRGIAEGSAADVQLARWLNVRPSDEFFETTFGIIQTLLDHLSPEESEARKQSLVAYCTQVASASGGLLGLWNTVSEIEHEAINHIATTLEEKHYTASRKIFDER